MVASRFKGPIRQLAARVSAFEIARDLRGLCSFPLSGGGGLLLLHLHVALGVAFVGVEVARGTAIAVMGVFGEIGEEPFIELDHCLPLKVGARREGERERWSHLGSRRRREGEGRESRQGRSNLRDK